LMENYSDEGFANVGVGSDVSIRELADIVKDVTGYQGRIVQDLSKPDGTPRKLMDVTRLSALGWKAQVELREGVAQTYAWFVE
ncbi:GDP-fucose synthetase, partial [Pseudomonas sp. GW460-13]